MVIYLAQHGKADYVNGSSERVLTESGMAETTKVATLAKDCGVAVDLIAHTSKQRSLQTAAIFAEFLNPQAGLQVVAGMEPNDDPVSFAREIKSQTNTLYVSHMPFVPSFISYLLTGSLNSTFCRVQNSAMFCLEQQGSRWQLNWIIPVSFVNL